MTTADEGGLEAARLAELASYRLTEATPDAVFTAIAEAASLIAGTPLAGVGLIDETREWFLGEVGGAPTAIPRKEALCDAVVRERAPVIIEDAGRDPRSAGNRFVAAAAARFYAGFPLTTPSGMVLGSLCVVDTVTRSLTPAQLTILSTLADQAMAQLELRRQTAEAYEAQDSLRSRNEVLNAVMANVDVGILVCDTDSVVLEHNDTLARIMGNDPDALGTAGEARPGSIRLLHLDGTPLLEHERPMVRTLREGSVKDLEVLQGSGEGRRTLRMQGTSLAGADGSVIGAMIVAHDLTEDRERERQLQIQMRDVGRLAEASRAVLTGRDASQIACEAVLELTEAQQVSLAVPDGKGNLVVTATTEELLRGYTVSLTDGAPMGQAFREGEPLLVDLAERSPRWDGAQLIESIHGVARGALFLPLMHEDECLGVLFSTIDSYPTVPPKRSRGLVDILAKELATALQRDRLGRELASQASTDPLTGLANRRDWDRRVGECLSLTDAPQCLAVLDLDFFKAFNDTLGHQAGDRLLASLAAAWRGGVRGADVLARLGGEEFGLLLTGCSLTDAAPILDGLRGLVPDGQTVSVGVAELRPGEGAESWYSRADKALYRAKTTGRDRVCVDDEPSPDRRRFAAPVFSAAADTAEA